MKPFAFTTEQLRSISKSATTKAANVIDGADCTDIVASMLVNRFLIIDIMGMPYDVVYDVLVIQRAEPRPF